MNDYYRVMELEVRVYMETNLKTRIFNFSTPNQEFFQWYLLIFSFFPNLPIIIKKKKKTNSLNNNMDE